MQALGARSGRKRLIKTVAVEEGQHVTQGQLLVALHAIETGADRHKVAQQLAQIRLEIARLRSVLGLPGGELLDNRPAGVDPLMLLLAQSLKWSQLAGEAEKLASFDREIDRQQAEARANQSSLR